MNEYTFSCTYDKKPHIEPIRRGMSVIYTGPGHNITEKAGMSELGEPARVFMCSKEDEIVGGLVGIMFGGWLYVSLL